MGGEKEAERNLELCLRLPFRRTLVLGCTGAGPAPHPSLLRHVVGESKKGPVWQDERMVTEPG